MNIKIATSVASLLLAQNLILANETTKLDNVQVVTTASGYAQDIVDAPASINVITAKDLEGKSYRDVSDALQDIPGITVEGGGGGRPESTQIYIRGMSEKYTLFMVDGKPQGSSQAYYNGFGNSNEIGWMPPLSSIERIEVIKGPMSSLYGSSAVGGVINIITKKVNNEWTGSLSLDTVLQENQDAGDSRQYRYYLSGPIIKDKLGLSVYGSMFKRDEDNFKDGFRKKEKYDNSAKLNWKVNDSNSLELIYGKAKQKNLGTIDKSGATHLDNERDNISLTHEVDWLNNNTTTYYTREDVKIDNGMNHSEYIRDTFNTKTVMPILDNNTVTFGLDYKKEETKHAKNRFHGKANANLERWQGAAFLEDEWFVTNDWSITTGFRYDENEHYGGEFIPRLYNVYKINEQFTLKGGVSKGYVAPELKQADPSIAEQSMGNTPRQRLDIGNYDLKPESSINYELALLYNHESGFDAGITAYHTRFKDKIEKQRICESTQGGKTGIDECEYNGQMWQGINEYTNVSSADLQGLETSIGYKNDIFKVNLNHTYSDSEQKSGKNKGKALNNLPKHMVNLGVDYTINKYINSWAKVKYKGKTVEDGDKQISAYTLVDLGINYKSSKYSSFYAGVYNLFDKQIDKSEYGKTLDGRRYNIGMKLDF
ncbi:Colicin I receptor precursor [Aliarcobacter thereius]|uniref:Colicin I receptor n=2 Tax=Aliarcobacter thereius TaxID=544718 RepID=A0A1C0B640_9BACT|nr:TonB-dependent receptor [Aliarcobacter thereius]OCL86299.1 Colicin I receptor precursor [Aliarcobacter thereius]OCL89983.1 Colicin I receptor precursor [Aliarcobacter thereius]OCL96417.1 Colicin I receptor precursor [Aliarcobacter thereius LMG 24486]OCL98622.1 Colicin I receptor precursor [Aliarcobacter thereius]QBF15621.1 TonB-dependent receptor [Aliarcobacter thereius LMG 24486]